MLSALPSANGTPGNLTVPFLLYYDAAPSDIFCPFSHPSLNTNGFTDFFSPPESSFGSDVWGTIWGILIAAERRQKMMLSV